MFKQMSEYFEPFFSKFQCCFRKSFSARQCLLSMFQKWKLAVNNRNKFGALLTDFSKIFDCLSRNLLNAKLNVYGFSINQLTDRLVKYYLTNHKQRTRIDSAYSSCEEILFGVPQELISGPLLVNIVVCDIVFIMDDIDFACCAGDNTPHTIGNDI